MRNKRFCGRTRPNVSETIRAGVGPHLGVALVISSLLLGCGIDAAVFGHLTATDQQQVPGAGNNFLSGQSSALGSGATVRFFTSAGTELPDLSTTTGASGVFQVTLPASTSFNNLLVEVSKDGIAYWGIVSEVRAKESVFIPDQLVNIADAVPEMADLDVDTTLTTLLMLGKATYGQPPVQLSSLTTETLADSATEIATLVSDGDDRVLPLREMLERLYSPGATTRPALVAFPATGGSYLNLDAVTPGTDVDGDGQPDTDVTAFEAALESAVGALEFDICFAEDKITVVFMVDFRDGNKDRNCSDIDRWKWTKDEEGKSMFIVGGLHEDTPQCDGENASAPPCLDQATFDEASLLLGNWQPNLIQMYDDGSNGDAVAGDDVWTLTVELPWFDAGSETAAWVRVAYKYTWGQGGALWTGSEEWPGNRRVLELRDTDGDRIVVRYDYYADETTNKDVQNLLSPVNGGCGSVLWNSEEPAQASCVYDTLENQIDTDGDCELDTKPTPGTASPITSSCGE